MPLERDAGPRPERTRPGCSEADGAVGFRVILQRSNQHSGSATGGAPVGALLSVSESFLLRLGRRGCERQRH